MYSLQRRLQRFSRQSIFPFTQAQTAWFRGVQISRSLSLSPLHDRCSYREALTETSRLWRHCALIFERQHWILFVLLWSYVSLCKANSDIGDQRTQKQGQQMTRETAFLLGVFIVVFYLIRQIKFASYFSAVICFCFLRYFS